MFDRESNELSVSFFFLKNYDWYLLHVGMATGWVQAEFLYARTHPTGLNPLPKLALFSKRVFFFQPQTCPAKPRKLHGPVPSCPAPNHNTNTNTDIKNTSFKSMNFPFKIANTNTKTYPNTNTNIDFINTKISDFPFQNHKDKYRS